MESNKNLCCLTSSIVFFSIVIFIATVCYIVFAIIGLVNTSLNKESDLCSDSHLWIYSLISLILLLKSKNTIAVLTQKEDDKNYNFIQTICEILILLGMCVWGAYEFFGVKCVNELNNTILYKTSFAYWIVNSILLFLLLLIMIIGFFSIVCITENNTTINTLIHEIKNIDNINNNID